MVQKRNNVDSHFILHFTGNWQTLEFNMVSKKFFQQLLKTLGNPQPHAVREQHHWRAPILSSLARKVTYRFYDLCKLKTALEFQNTVALKEKVNWNGDKQVEENLCQLDPREALAAAKSRAHNKKVSKDRITCKSNIVVGYGEGRATRELDIIWWPNLYRTNVLGKMCIRLFVSRVQLIL